MSVQNAFRGLSLFRLHCTCGCKGAVDLLMASQLHHRCLGLCLSMHCFDWVFSNGAEAGLSGTACLQCSSHAIWGACLARGRLKLMDVCKCGQGRCKDRLPAEHELISAVHSLCVVVFSELMHVIVAVLFLSNFLSYCKCEWSFV